jgi:hypothetical protein
LTDALLDEPAFPAVCAFYVLRRVFYGEGPSCDEDISASDEKQDVGACAHTCVPWTHVFFFAF